ncbi:hypothetical protein BDZ91DRAFT_772210 [Kalaharituber pfeilii]|nr:hypothetical protein BDZ91DRAFT_772210 [Kalaharituber pfeilii]
MAVGAATSEDRIIVGIDFGTTHSAVAWALTSSSEEYEVITTWPGQVGKDWGKVPSDISYTVSSGSGSEGGPTSPTGEEHANTEIGYKWGFEVPPLSPNRLSWIKILLDPSQPRPQFVNPKRTPVDIVTDYLTALKNYTMLTLERRLGREFLYGTGAEADQKKLVKPVDFVLTVPAVWSDKARQMTLEAAVRAGLGVGIDMGVGSGTQDQGGGGAGLLRLITEPEGAAEYALRSMQPGMLKVGECFVVCDAGGGTVDLISYKIASLHPLQLHECVVGSGGLCGAVYLDRRFEDFIQRRIGKETFDGMSHRARFQMNQYWETYIKREFNNIERVDDDEGGDADFHVPVVGVPDSKERGVKAGFLKVTRAEVHEIFEPIVTQVIDLISSQVLSVLKSSHGPISAIVLVGGFGSSEYLYRRIVSWSNSKIPIIQPRNAWTAVVRGAILRGLQGDVAVVQSRLSRRYYGVVHDSSFDPTKHHEEDKRWHELRCEWVVRNRMQWYIRRGDVTTEAKKISFPFYRTISVDDVKGGKHQLRTELWVCDEEKAPDKRDSTVRKLAVMTSEPVDVNMFSKHVNEKGKGFYRVDYSLDMTVTSGLVIYEMRIEGHEDTVACVTTKYE